MQLLLVLFVVVMRVRIGGWFISKRCIKNSLGRSYDWTRWIIEKRKRKTVHNNRFLPRAVWNRKQKSKVAILIRYDNNRTNYMNKCIQWHAFFCLFTKMSQFCMETCPQPTSNMVTIWQSSSSYLPIYTFLSRLCLPNRQVLKCGWKWSMFWSEWVLFVFLNKTGINTSSTQEEHQWLLTV